jgi:hypothetical protein
MPVSLSLFSLLASSLVRPEQCDQLTAKEGRDGNKYLALTQVIYKAISISMPIVSVRDRLIKRGAINNNTFH